MTPSRPPVVLLAGFLGAAEDFDGLRRGLVGRDTVAGSPCDMVEPGTGSFDAAADQVAAWIRGQGVDRCHLLGYSMGGRLTLALALRFPALVAAAAAVGANPGIEDPDERLRRRALDIERARRLEADLGTFLDGWYAQPLFDALRTSADFDATLARRRRIDPAAHARALRVAGPGSQPPMQEALRDLRTPTLLLAGELDTKYAALNADLVGRSRLLEAATVPDAGHAPHLENPESCAAIAADFFDRHEQSHGDD